MRARRSLAALVRFGELPQGEAHEAVEDGSRPVWQPVEHPAGPGQLACQVGKGDEGGTPKEKEEAEGGGRREILSYSKDLRYS